MALDASPSTPLRSQNRHFVDGNHPLTLSVALSVSLSISFLFSASALLASSIALAISRATSSVHGKRPT